MALTGEVKCITSFMLPGARHKVENQQQCLDPMAYQLPEFTCSGLTCDLNPYSSGDRCTCFMLVYPTPAHIVFHFIVIFIPAVHSTYFTYLVASLGINYIHILKD